MKLESLTLNKFKDCSLKKEQMFVLDGGRNERTGAGHIVTDHSNLGMTHINYGYDVDRDNGTRTYHDRSFYHEGNGDCQYI